MFGNDENQDQNQNHGQITPLGGAPMPGVDNAAQAQDPASSPLSHAATVVTPAATSSPANPAITPVHSDLLDIKQQALQHLSPLVGQLEQSPEEKFRTTMMMIQASDDQSLVKEAYEAAKQITDEKARAQALLDVINEINYFTQQKDK